MRAAVAFLLLATIGGTALPSAAATGTARTSPASIHAARSGATAAPARQNSGSEEAFWEALMHDDARSVQTFLLRGVDTNIVHPEFGPAIVTAARERSWNVVRALAGIVGTRIDAPNARGETAAMLAALRGNLDIVRRLVEKGAQINRPGWTVLHYAAIDGSVELLQYLLDQNAYIDAESPNRTTPLMMAARHENIDAVHLLVDAGADPTVRNEAGLDAAAYLASHQMIEEARWMRERAEAFSRRYRAPGKARAAPGQAGAKQPERTAESPKPAAPAAQSPGAETQGPADRARTRARPSPSLRLPGMRD